MPRHTTRYDLAPLWLICLLLLAACTPNAQPETQQIKAFSARFKAANQAENIEPMLALYYLNGAEANTVTLLKTALQFEHQLPIKSIHFEPLNGSPEEAIHFTHNGVHYGPSLPPALRMRVTYDTEDQFTSLFTLGQDPNNQWRIICARPTQQHPPKLSYTPAPL